MLIDAALRTEAAAKDMLACVKDGSASTSELRRMLEISKSISTVVSAAQASGAAMIAGRHRHGDGGAEVLASSAGLSRRDAESHVKAARSIEAAPAVRDAVEAGRVSMANAKRLAEAVEKTSAQDVQSDHELLAKAETMRPEQFAREARRWAIERQGDSGQTEHARQRSKRFVRVWDAEDGMVRLHGEFDAVTGRRISNRLQAEARRMYDHDKKQATNGAHGERRTFKQCMADALDNLTASASGTNGSGPVADISVVVHVDPATGKLIAEIPGGDRLPRAVLEEIACNSNLTGTVYDTRGTLLWQGYTKRTATPTQLKALRAIYGGCFACAAHPDMCQAHHVKPVSEGGPTNVDNMVLACWNCHHKIHHFGWQIHGTPGKRTLHPPDGAHYGPAHAPDSPSMFDPDAGRVPARTTRSESLGSGPRSRARAPATVPPGTDRDEPAGPSPPVRNGRLFASV